MKKILVVPIFTLLFVVSTPSCKKESAPKTVHIVGARYDIGVSTFLPTYWRNNEKITFTSGTNNGDAKDLALVGNDVYISGFTRSAPGAVINACYWKNGVVNILGDLYRSLRAEKMFVNGTDVYIAGYEGNGTVNVAKYWKNGVATNLSNGILGATCLDVAVSGADVYAVGKQISGSSAKEYL